MFEWLFKLAGSKSPEWRRYVAILRRPLVDGGYARGDLMRRWYEGAWQYRRMTQDEETEAFFEDAW